jgi:alkylation response protein AidB-like acyl-CoA dehydrogenase
VSVALTEEQEEFQRTVRSFLESRFKEEDLRRLAASEDGRDEVLWQAFTELELHALGVPEELGGAGGSWVELGLLLEEMGAVLVSSPYFASTVLAAPAIAELDPEEQQVEWIERIRSGELIATMALPGKGGGWAVGGTAPLRAERADGAWRLSGVLHRVIDGAIARLIVVVADTAEGRHVFAVERPDASVTATPVATLDPSRKMATVEFEGAPAVPLGSDLDATATVDRIVERATIALAAEQLGAARRCLDAAVAYAKDRQQHGQPIGSFQAIKHRCADIFVAIEAARSVVFAALSLAAEPDAPLTAVTSVAKASASEALSLAAAGSIQIHGGIGVSWEHSAHFYLKRAKASEMLLGSPADHRERVAQWLAL